MAKLTDEFYLKDDFEETSYEDWKQMAEKDLAGIPIERLKTRTYEGIYLKFIYTQDDIKNLDQLSNKPGYKNFLRGTKTGGYLDKPWLIAQEIPYVIPKDFNNALRFDLSKGQSAIKILLNKASQKSNDVNKEIEPPGVYIQNLNDINNVFENIDITNFPVFVQTGFSTLGFLILFVSYAKEKGIDLNKIKGAFESDPFDFAISEGHLPIPVDKVFDEMSLVTKWTLKNIPNLKTIGVSSLNYHNAGANSVQELAFSLSTAVEYIKQMLERGLKIDEIASNIRFTFGIGSLFFVEVAKIRAARMLWAKIIEAFSGNEDSQKIDIHAHTSFTNQTVFDPYVNLLRTTTEAFSAITGGVDSMHTNFFDESFRTPDEFSRRIARNTQIILNEESHLNQIIDPAGGSYYVESLTDEVAKKSWALFQEIEGEGGMLKSLEEGFPQHQTEKIANEKKTNFAKRRGILVGTNLYANMKEKKLEVIVQEVNTTLKKNADEFKKSRNENELIPILDELIKNTENIIDKGITAVIKGVTLNELSNAVRKNYKEEIKIKTLKIHRLAEPIEELRDASLEYKNKTGHLPKVFLLPMGPLAQNKARADFSRGFFEVGGFDVISKQRFHTVESAIDMAIKTDSKVIVICSTDETYPELVPVITKGIKEKRNDAMIILAGYPKDFIDQFKQNGIDEFIYVGADLYHTLKNIMIKTGVISK
jgi:methylmalonyl-CoA mutase